MKTSPFEMMHRAAALLVFVTGTACSEAPVIVEFPQTEGASVFVIVRSELGTRFFAAPTEGPKTIIEIEEGEAQLLSFRQDLTAAGLIEGEVTSSEEVLSAPLPSSLATYSFSTAAGGWTEAPAVWAEAETFRVAPGDVCPNYLFPEVEVLEVEPRLNAALFRDNGQLILVASSSVAGGQGEVYIKERGQPLITVESDTERRMAVAEIEGTVWTVGTQIWSSQQSSGWDATSVASSADLQNELAVSLAGPVTFQGQLYEVVVLTREGGLWGWTGSELRRLAEGYPTEEGVATLKVGENLLFARFSEGRPERMDNFLVELGPAGIRSTLVPEAVTDNLFRSKPILGMTFLDDRVFVAAANIAELEDFEEGTFQTWSETNDTNFMDIARRENHLYLPTSRRALFASRSINGIQLTCDGQVARASQNGSIDLSKVFDRTDGLTWITQGQTQGLRLTQVFWLDEV